MKLVLKSALYVVVLTVLLGGVYPAAVTVVVGDMDSPVIDELAWDLGASYVLLPPQSRELLLEVIANLMGNLRSQNEAD